MTCDVSKTLRQELERHAPWVFGIFTVIDEEYDAKHFGNSHVTVVGPAFWLQFVRDRGEIGADIASAAEPNTWWDLHWVSELIPGTGYPLPEILPVTEMIRDNYSQLSEMFGSHYRRTKQELRGREGKRKQEMWQRFGKK